MLAVLIFIISTLFSGAMGFYINFGVAGFIFGGLIVIVHQLQTIINLMKKIE